MNPMGSSPIPGHADPGPMTGGMDDMIRIESFPNPGPVHIGGMNIGRGQESTPPLISSPRPVSRPGASEVLVGMDDRSVREVMRELGVGLGEVARLAGVDRSHVGRQLRGVRPMSRAVRAAVVDVLESRAVRCLTLTAGLLRRHGEPGAAGACERLWERLGSPAPDASTPPRRSPHP